VLTLTTVRQAINTRMPGYSFIGLAITSTVANPDIPTIGINKEGVLLYNPDFIQEHIKDDVDLFTVIMHEIFHILYHHVFYANDNISNIAMDAIINATLSKATDFSEATARGKFFRNYYKDFKTIPNVLLRPGSKMEDSIYKQVYKTIYEGEATSFDLINILKTTLPAECKSDRLLGNHRAPQDPRGPQDTLDVGSIATELGTKLQGDGGGLFKLLKKILEQHLSIKQSLLKRFADKLAVDTFTFDANVKRVFRSPVPIRPSRRDMVLLAGGYDIVFWNNVVDTSARSKAGGITVYLDVSGSCDTVLPKILGILKRHRKQINKIYTWSTECVETDLDTLFKGEIHTTWGTNIACVLEHMRGAAVKKAIIFTDGYFGGVYGQRDQETVEKVDLLTILFFLSDHIVDKIYKENSEIVFLDNIVE
jgi:hypothetical protein